MSQILVTVALVANCCAIMAPRLLSPEFGLLDDGTTLLIAGVYRHDPLGVIQIEASRGRFRPVYWLYYIRQYPLWGTSPVGYFAVQWLVLTLTTLLIAQTVADATDSPLSAVSAGIAFLIAGPVWEAYYTLSKPEPPLVFCVAAASLCLFRAIRNHCISTTVANCYAAGFAIFSGLAYFTKETALVLLPVSIIFAVIAWSRTTARPVLVSSCVANLVWFTVFMLGRWLTHTSAIGAGTDSSNYHVELAQISASATDDLAWIGRDFAFVIPLIGTAIYVVTRGRTSTAALLITTFGGLIFAGWMLIMLPWASSFEYYLLPPSLGIALIVGGSVYVVRGSTKSNARTLIALSVSAALACIPLLNGVTEGRLQLMVDATNAELVAKLAGSVPAGGAVATSLPADSEYVFELQMQLRELYGRSDVHVTGTQTAASDEALLAIQRVENRPVVMPRIATGLPAAESGRAAVWSTTGQVRLNLINAQEPLCRMLREVGFFALGFMCRDPALLVDTREFKYGWELARPR